LIATILKETRGILDADAGDPSGAYRVRSRFDPFAPAPPAGRHRRAAMGRKHHRNSLSDARHLSLLPCEPGASPERQWRHRRNMVMYLIRREGVPYKLLCDAFDLGIVQVRQILKKLAEADKSRGTFQAPKNGVTRRIIGKAGAHGTSLQRLRSRRNAVICLGYKVGLSRALLGDVFELSRGAVATILKPRRRRQSPGRARSPRRTHGIARPAAR
jgi:hypothetical protein